MTLAHLVGLVPRSLKFNMAACPPTTNRLVGKEAILSGGNRLVHTQPLTTSDINGEQILPLSSPISERKTTTPTDTRAETRSCPRHWCQNVYSNVDLWLKTCTFERGNNARAEWTPTLPAINRLVQCIQISLGRAWKFSCDFTVVRRPKGSILYKIVLPDSVVNTRWEIVQSDVLGGSIWNKTVVSLTAATPMTQPDVCYCLGSFEQRTPSRLPLYWWTGRAILANCWC